MDEVLGVVVVIGAGVADALLLNRIDRQAVMYPGAESIETRVVVNPGITTGTAVVPGVTAGTVATLETIGMVDGTF